MSGATPMPGGHINDSFRVATDRGEFLLQRLNPAVFKDAAPVMDNIARVSSHLEAARASGRTTLEPLRLVPAKSGDRWLNHEGACWRMYGFVGNARVVEQPDSADRVREAARAFGEFTAALADFDGPPLAVTIAGFHDTPRYLDQLELLARDDPASRAAGADAELAELRGHAGLIEVLPPLLAAGQIKRRVAHNDAKLANVLFDEDTGRARSVVDLDTVMTGTVLFDFGDMVRSMTSGAAEDADPGTVRVDLPLFKALSEGFLESAGAILTRLEKDLLMHAGLLVTYEQAVRFLADYLAGDRYYRVSDPAQNLRRARAQLALFASMLACRTELEAIVRDVSRRW